MKIASLLSSGELVLAVDGKLVVKLSFLLEMTLRLLQRSLFQRDQATSCFIDTAIVLLRVLLLLLGDLVGEVEKDLLPTLPQRLLPFLNDLIGYFGALFKC